MDDAFPITFLPDDPQTLKQIIADLSCQRDDWRVKFQNIEVEKHNVEVEKQKIEIEKLRLEMELLRLKKWYYGPRADNLKYYTDVAQMLLAFVGELEARPVDLADLPPGDAPATEPETKDVRRVGKGRRNLAEFDQLPVIRREHDLPEEQKPCPCCGNTREKIGEESSWQVEYVPGHFERIEHIRIKYACKHCEANADNPRIELADKPQQPIEKGMAGPGLLAYVVTSKYADYLPLYRLESIFQRNGLEISRATQSIWCRDVAEIVKPLFDLMVMRVLASHVICTDDTVMPMLWPGKTKQARM